MSVHDHVAECSNDYSPKNMEKYLTEKRLSKAKIYYYLEMYFSITAYGRNEQDPETREELGVPKQKHIKEFKDFISRHQFNLLKALNSNEYDYTHSNAKTFAILECLEEQKIMINNLHFLEINKLPEFPSNLALEKFFNYPYLKRGKDTNVKTIVDSFEQLDFLQILTYFNNLTNYWIKDYFVSSNFKVVFMKGLRQ